MNEKMPHLDKTALSTGRIQDESEEKNYWLSKTPEERLEALEINRRMVYGEHESTSRLQRLLEVAPFPGS